MIDISHLLIGSSNTVSYGQETRWEGFLIILGIMAIVIVIGSWIQKKFRKDKEVNISRDYNPNIRRRNNWFLNSVDTKGCEMKISAGIGRGGSTGAGSGGGRGGGFSGGGGRFGGGGASGRW